MSAQNCPLCNIPSEFIGTDYGKRKAFNCGNCTEFIISNLAETRLEQAPQKWKEDFSAKAKKAPSDKVLVITAPSSPQQSGGVASVALVGEYVLREN